MANREKPSTDSKESTPPIKYKCDSIEKIQALEKTYTSLTRWELTRLRDDLNSQIDDLNSQIKEYTWLRYDLNSQLRDDLMSQIEEYTNLKNQQNALLGKVQTRINDTEPAFQKKLRTGEYKQLLMNSTGESYSYIDLRPEVQAKYEALTINGVTYPTLNELDKAFDSGQITIKDIEKALAEKTAAQDKEEANKLMEEFLNKEQ